MLICFNAHLRNSFCEHEPPTIRVVPVRVTRPALCPGPGSSRLSVNLRCVSVFALSLAISCCCCCCCCCWRVSFNFKAFFVACVRATFVVWLPHERLSHLLPAAMAASCQLELIIALCSEQITFRFPFSSLPAFLYLPLHPHVLLEVHYATVSAAIA